MKPSEKYVQIIPRYSFRIPMDKTLNGKEGHLLQGKIYHAIEREDSTYLVLDERREGICVAADHLTPLSFNIIR